MRPLISPLITTFLLINYHSLLKVNSIMNFLLSIASIALLLFPFANTASAYTQDPRSCSDPRTQYPSNPPCQSSPDLFSVKPD
jgi:hypothetical protein